LHFCHGEARAYIPTEPGDSLVNIRFISTLTADDENQIAPGLLKAVTALLDRFPIAYTVRIETTGAQVFQHSHPSFDADGQHTFDAPIVVPILKT
jgi:hypothetical protein